MCISPVKLDILSLESMETVSSRGCRVNCKHFISQTQLLLLGSNSAAHCNFKLHLQQMDDDPTHRVTAPQVSQAKHSRDPSLSDLNPTEHVVQLLKTRPFFEAWKYVVNETVALCTYPFSHSTS